MSMRKSEILSLVAGAAMVLASGVASAEEHIVKAVVTNWDPLVVFVKPGDTVRWTNMAGHDTANVEGMIPEGATAWHSKMGEELVMQFDKPGAYIYKCTPHVSAGMVGAIVVGDGAPGNLAQIDAALETVPDAKNMVARAIRKMKMELEKRGGS